jgi:hypothetical protein
MKDWRSFGASVIGPAHIATGKPNQDSWVAFRHIWGAGIATSDGLGSKIHSHFGSYAACRAVALAIQSCRGHTTRGDDFLPDRIRKNWLSLIAPLGPRDCAATCLFAFQMEEEPVRMGMIGDGLVAAVRVDGSVVSMTDDKEEGFSNITAAMSPDVTEKDWRWLSIPAEECKTVILCTDGVADDLIDIDGFVRDFTGEHRNLSSVSASRRTRTVLSQWPVNNHSDDKTIACLVNEGVEDE